MSILFLTRAAQYGLKKSHFAIILTENALAVCDTITVFISTETKNHYSRDDVIFVLICTHVFIHLLEHLSRITVPHYNAVFFLFSFSKYCDLVLILQFGYCTWPYCDFNN